MAGNLLPINWMFDVAALSTPLITTLERKVGTAPTPFIWMINDFLLSLLPRLLYKYTKLFLNIKIKIYNHQYLLRFVT